MTLKHLIAGLALVTLSTPAMSMDGIYGELRYNVQVSDDFDVRDSAFTGTEGVSSNASGLDFDSDENLGFAIGYRMGMHNFAVAYEVMDAQISIGELVEFDGGIADKFPLSGGVDVDSFFIEYSAHYNLSDNTTLFGLIGVGRSDIETPPLSAAGYSNVTCSDDKSSTSVRYGIGAQHDVSEAVGLKFVLQNTRYGDSVFIDRDDNTDACTTRSTTQFKDIENTEIGLGLIYRF